MTFLKTTPYNNTLGPPIQTPQPLSYLNGSPPYVTQEQHFNALDMAFFVQEFFLGVIAVLGIVGNILVCYTVVKRAQVKHSTWYFLCCLSISDAFVCLINVPILMLATYDESYIKNGTFLCQFNGFCLVCFFLVSVLSLAGMSLHKYYYIKRPLQLRASTKSLKLIGFIWAVSIGIALGPLVGWSEFSHVHGHKQCIPKSILSPTTNDFSYLAVLLFVGFFLPLISMVYCYTSIFIETLSHHKRLNNNSIRGESATSARRAKPRGRNGRRGSVSYDWGILKTVFVVVTTFILCWTPLVVYISFNFTRNATPPLELSQIAFMMAYIQSILNPVIYALRHDLFRKQFKSVLCCFKYDNVDIGRSERSGSGTHPSGSLFIVDGMSRSSSSSSDSTLVFYQRKDTLPRSEISPYAPRLDSISERSISTSFPLSYDNQVFQLASGESWNV